MNKRLRLNKETLRALTSKHMEEAAGGIVPKPSNGCPSVSCLDCSARPYVCITKKPNGDCPILP